MRSKFFDTSYIGKVFGRLKILDVGLRITSTNEIAFKCSCSCNGNVKLYPARKVVSGRVASCGCTKVNNRSKYFSKDYIGQEFGDFVVTSIHDKATSEGVVWDCICNYCGRKISLPACDIVKGNNISCGCIRSRHEVMLKNIFDRRGIDYETEYSFDDLLGINGGLLRFDFYLKSRGLLLEYDGRQHDLSHQGGSWDVARVHEHDKLKDQYCKSNNIPLVRISGVFKDDADLEVYLEKKGGTLNDECGVF